MPVQYVSDFSFAPSPPRPTIRGYARGGHVSGDIKVTATRAEKSSGVQKPAFAKGGGIKLSGSFEGKSNAIGQGGRAAQLKAKGVPGGVIGNLARKAQAAPGQKNYHATGGSAKCYADGGKVAAGKQWMGSKPSRNPDDATSPGSFKRTPMGQGEKNSSAAKSQFSAQGRNTPV